MSIFKLSLLATALIGLVHAESPDINLTGKRRRSGASYYTDNKGRVHLKLDNNNEYRIMQVTDLHFGEDPDRDDQTINMIRDVIRKEDPDFMAVTGDLVSGQIFDFEYDQT